MAHEKDIILAVKQVIGLDQRGILLERLKEIRPNENGEFTEEQLDKIFEGMPDLRKIFSKG